MNVVILFCFAFVNLKIIFLYVYFLCKLLVIVYINVTIFSFLLIQQLCYNFQQCK